MTNSSNGCCAIATLRHSSAALWLAAALTLPALCEAVLACAETVQPACDLLPCLLALGGCSDGRALTGLAKLMYWQTDRWTWAAAQSSVAGRERAFLDAVVDFICRPEANATDATNLMLLAEAARLAGRARPVVTGVEELARLEKIDIRRQELDQKVLLVGFVDGAFTDPTAGFARAAHRVTLEEGLVPGRCAWRQLSPLTHATWGKRNRRWCSS